MGWEVRLTVQGTLFEENHQLALGWETAEFLLVQGTLPDSREPSARTGMRDCWVSLGSRNSPSQPEENHQLELGWETVGFLLVEGTLSHNRKRTISQNWVKETASFSWFKELSLTPGRREPSARTGARECWVLYVQGALSHTRKKRTINTGYFNLTSTHSCCAIYSTFTQKAKPYKSVHKALILWQINFLRLTNKEKPQDDWKNVF